MTLLLLNISEQKTYSFLGVTIKNKIFTVYTEPFILTIAMYFVLPGAQTNNETSENVKDCLQKIDYWFNSLMFEILLLY